MKQDQLEKFLMPGNSPIAVVDDDRTSIIELSALEGRDAITGLLSRDGIYEACKVAAAASAQVVAVHIDLEGFQTINHHHGFEQGDDVLRVIAQRLTDALPDSAAIARVSGDEFLVIAGGDRPHGEYLARRLLTAADEPIPLETGGRATVNARAGWVAATADFDQDLLRQATFALHEAKASGVRVTEYVEQLAARVAQRRQTEIELRNAVVNEQFLLHGQTVVDVFEERISAIELHLRWRHPIAGLLKPKRFLPMAEECGFIEDIDKWVVRRFVENAVLTHPTLHFAVNLSTQTISKPASLGYIADMLGRSGVPSGRMHVDLTQSEAAPNSAALVTATRALADAGVNIAIDNFGGGYASLAALTNLSVTTLKLDKSLVASVDTATGSGIVRAIVGFAKRRNIDVVATGVSTFEQAQILKEIGCRFHQGDYYQPVAPMDEILDVVGRRRQPAPLALRR